MLIPKRTKYRKQFRGRMKGKATRGNKIMHGEYGIMACEPCWVKSNQIEAARVAMTRHMKRGGVVWITIFPDKPGRVMFEVGGVTEEVAHGALRLAMHKLPLKCKIVSRRDQEGDTGES